MTTHDSGGHTGSTDYAPGSTVPPAPPPRRIRPTLRRSDSDRLITGVAGGLAEHTGIDAILFRVGFVALTAAGGAGLLLYVALWALLPDADGRPGPLTRRLNGGRQISGTTRTVLITIAAIIAAIWLFGVTDNWNGGLLIVLAVGLVAYLMVRDDRRTPSDPPQQMVSLTKDDPDPVAVPRVRRRRRNPLGRITVSVLFVVLGAMAWADQRDGYEVLARGYLGVALGIIGVGLIVGAVWGRSRGLIVLAVPVLVLLIGASSVAGHVQGGIGNRTWVPSTVDGIAGSYELGVGDARLDLAAVDFTGSDVTTSAELGVGNLQVTVPSDVDVHVTSTVRAGSLILFGDRRGDRNARRTLTDNGTDGAGGGNLTLTLTVGLGQLEVIRVP